METVRRLWNKYREYILYVIFGGFTTLISWFVFWLCNNVLRMDVVPANIISWILAVAFAYITNRIWVFESRASGLKPVIREIAGFAGGRLVTLGLETLFLWLTVDIFKWNSMLMKIVISIVVLVLNYIISRFMVFKKEKK
ncbi:MAG: GtrA family protein [Parasporobacterium sp.]|nr:GtrA family protein [Parasporobacterium sp.]